MEKIGIMGGTFNPIHTAHLILAESAREQAGLSKVMFLPSKRTQEKAGAYILPDKERCVLVGLAIAGNPYFYLSKMEMERGGMTYTADTVSALKQENPETEYYFIIGGDSLLSFENWSRPEVILANVHLLATSRGGCEARRISEAAKRLRERYGADVILFDTPAMGISSTDIRTRCKKGSSLRYLVPAAVEEYLTKHGCYRELLIGD